MQKIYLSFFLLYLCNIALAQPLINDVHSWAFQLQNFDVNTIATNSTFQLVVTDYSHDGSNATKLTTAEVATVKNSGKLHVSYISIGEAEDYRSYWQPAWSNNPPVWLGAENPDWAGNYKVKYWEPAWQNVVFSYVDTIIAQGFDGIYLDIIDAWYYWQQEVPVGQRVANADSLMIDFVLRIRNHINTVTGDSSFVIIPQNGEDLIYQPAISPALRSQYLDAIDAVGIEDVFFTGANDMDNPYAPDYYRLNNLLQYQAAGKKILTIEYISQPVKLDQYKDTATKYAFVAYACTRPLDQLCDGIALSIEQNIKQVINLYPNPVTGNTIVLQRSEGLADKNQIYLVDMHGRRIDLHSESTGHHSENFAVDIPSTIANGLYLIAMQNATTLSTHRLILQR